MRKVRSAGYEMTVLDGTFSPLVVRDFSGRLLPGRYGLAQPMANAAFYYLEPKARDGFVGWGLLDERLRPLVGNAEKTIYPIFEYRREIR
jgi:hypothetical protein